MKTVRKVGASGRCHQRYRKQRVHQRLCVRVGAAEGIGKAGDAAQLFHNAVMAELNVIQHPGLEIRVGLACAALHAVGALGVIIARILV